MSNVEDKDRSKQKRKKNRDKQSGIEENILKKSIHDIREINSF